MTSYVRLLWVFLRLGALNEAQYRANFYIQLFQSLVGLGTALAGMGMIFGHTDALGGWRPAELLALLGVYFLVGGAINLVIQPSMQRLMEQVRLGTLDFTLTKPEDAQVLVSVQEVRLWKLIDVALGLGLLATALARLEAEVGVGTALTFGAALLAGGVIVYGFWLMLATLSFWFVRVDNILVIFQSMYEAGRWPIGIYPPWLRAALTFLVPVAFATTVPAEALIGRLTPPTLLSVVALAAGMLAVARWFWRFGLRHYGGASA
jgi:ABC-2 type transport system permease protein